MLAKGEKMLENLKDVLEVISDTNMHKHVNHQMEILNSKYHMVINLVKVCQAFSDHLPSSYDHLGLFCL